jgi:hypothetical protein
VTTYRRATEVAQLASVLLSEYVPGTPLHELLRQGEVYQDPTDSGETVFTIWVNAAASDVAGMVASVDAIQLAFDAACVVVAYDQSYPDRTDELPTFAALLDFAFSPIGSLQIYDLYSGSWGAKLVALYRDGVTRSAIGTVAPLTLLALHVACPLMVIPTTVALGASAAGGLAGLGSAILDRQLKKKEEKARAAAAEAERKKREADDQRRDRERDELQDQLRRLDDRQETRSAHSGSPVDADAILGAGAKVTMKVTDSAAPPRAAD